MDAPTPVPEWLDESRERFETLRRDAASRTAVLNEAQQRVATTSAALRRAEAHVDAIKALRFDSSTFSERFRTAEAEAARCLRAFERAKSAAQRLRAERAALGDERTLDACGRLLVALGAISPEDL